MTGARHHSANRTRTHAVGHTNIDFHTYTLAHMMNAWPRLGLRELVESDKDATPVPTPTHLSS